MALDRDTGKAVVLEQRALLNWAAVADDVRSMVENDAVSTPVAQGDPAIISLECRDPGTRATVMLAKGLLVVRHSDGFCNTFPLIAPYGHSLEQRPIPWAKAAYLQELRKPVSGFWGVFGSYWGVRVRFQYSEAPLPASTEWAQQNDPLFGDRGRGVVLAPPQPLPFIFRRGPRWCYSVARRQRLLAVLLSQHTRAGSISPLRAISEAGLLRMILHAACPDLFPSPARTTGGGGATLSDTNGDGGTTADGAGGRDCSEEIVAGGDSGEGVNNGCIADEEEPSSVSALTSSRPSDVIQNPLVNASSEVESATPGTPRTVHAIGEYPWKVLFAQVSEFCRGQGLEESSAVATQLSDLSENITSGQVNAVLTWIKNRITSADFAAQFPIVKLLEIQVGLPDVLAVFRADAWPEPTAADPFFDWALCYIAAASGCRFWDKKGIHLAGGIIPETNTYTHNPCSVKQYIVVGGDVLRAFQNSDRVEQLGDDRIALNVLPLPCDLIFTNVGALGWVAISIDSSKKVLAFTPGIGNPPSTAYEKFKKQLKHVLGSHITGNIIHKKLIPTVASSVASDSSLEAGYAATYGAYSLNLARTASAVFGGLRAPISPCNGVAGVRAWILGRMISLSKAAVSPAAGNREPDVTGGGGGGGGEGGGEGGGGGGADSGRSEPGEVLTDKAADKNRGVAGSGPSGHDSGASSNGSGPGSDGRQNGKSHQSTLFPDDETTEDEDSDDKPSHGPATKPTHEVPETESDSDEDVDMSSADHTLIKAGDSGEADAHAKVMAEIRAACDSQNIPGTVAQGVDKILEVYQQNGCRVVRMLSLDSKKILVLAAYHGNTYSVLSPQGPLLPQGQFAIMISALWRTKSRVKNDPAFRHAAHVLQISTRTKHLTTDYVAAPQPIRLFKHGACMGLISRDRPLKKGSLVLGFTSIPYAEKGLWDHIRTQTTSADKEILSDSVRQTVRKLEFGIRVLNQKGLAVGPVAIDSAQITNESGGRIIFPDLSQAAVFPETENQYSRQAQEATNYMLRSNSSCSWERVNPTDSHVEFSATFLSDASVFDVLRNERQSGGGLALASSDNLIPEEASRGKGIKTHKGLKKMDAFQKDQQSVARNLACVLRFPASPPTNIERESFLKEVSTILKSRKRVQDDAAVRRTVELLAGGCSGPGQRILDRHWNHCAYWFLRSMGKHVLANDPEAQERFLADQAEEHLFLTAYIPQTSLSSLISGDGLRVEGSVFTLPQGWTLLEKSDRCSFLDQRLPAVVVKLESEAKGTGLFAGQRVGKKELVCVYIGDYVSDPGARPSSRMVVKHTSYANGSEWAYCYGIEDLSRCLSLSALGPSVNAPSSGEATNCSLGRNEWAILKDQMGTKMLAYPVTSDCEIANGEPFLWAYNPQAASGRNFTTLA